MRIFASILFSLLLAFIVVLFLPTKKLAEFDVEGHINQAGDSDADKTVTGSAAGVESGGSASSTKIEALPDRRGIQEVWSHTAPDLTQLYWQTRSEQCFSAGLDLQEIAQNLYDDMANATLDRESITAPSEGILEYHLKEKPGVFVLRGTGEDAFLGLYYYYTPESPIVLDGVERTLISYSFHLGMNGYYGLFVEAKSKSDNPNVWRGINYSHPQGAEPFCQKFFPPGSQMTSELYPVLGPLELNEEVLVAWKEKMMSLAKSVKPKEFK